MWRGEKGGECINLNQTYSHNPDSTQQDTGK